MRALLYLPEMSSGHLALAEVAGRALALRVLVAAARAGVTDLAVPHRLRVPRIERQIARARDLAGRIRWLDPQAPAPAFTGERWLLLPASTLLDPASVSALVASADKTEHAVLAESAATLAPVVLAPAPVVVSLWPFLGAGTAAGPALAGHLAATDATPVPGPGTMLAARAPADLDRVEAALYERLGSPIDTSVDVRVHRRCSRWITRGLVRTPVTPNLVSLASLAVGLAAIWCLWGATPASAGAGVALYALASILDHADGEVARLTFQESPLGAQLDWLIDTVIHAGLVLAMAVTAGGALMVVVGLLGAAGVALSALLARTLPREIEVGPSVGSVLAGMGNRDLFYLLLIAFVALRWWWPAALPVLALVVALGSQTYWLACLGRWPGRAAGRR